jgi:hypothetical protein
MTDVTLPEKDQRTKEKFNQRQGNFYGQTVAENNARLNGKPENFRSLFDEIKFIEAELISRFGDRL